MKKRSLIAVALGVSVVIAFGGLYASNMGFKLNQLLEQQTAGVSATGQTQLGLPYNPQTSITRVVDLYNDINATAGASVVVSISRFAPDSDTLQTYTGSGGDGLPGSANDYVIDGIEGQRIQVASRVNYIVVGSHDPGRVISLDAQGTNSSATGQTELSFPYHGTATNAAELYDEINSQSGSGNAVVSISKFNPAGDALFTYANSGSSINFPTAPGESYRIQVDVGQDVAYVPSHY